jgi:hypothetical protein
VGMKGEHQTEGDVRDGVETNAEVETVVRRACRMQPMHSPGPDPRENGWRVSTFVNPPQNWGSLLSSNPRDVCSVSNGARHNGASAPTPAASTHRVVEGEVG